MTDEARVPQKRPWLLALLIVLLAAYAANEFREIARLRVAVESLQRAAEKDHQALAEEKYRAAIAAAAAVVTVTSTFANSGVPQGTDLTPLIENEPEYRVLHAQHMARLVQRTYGKLEALKLAPDQEQALVKLLGERLTSTTDALDAALKRGIRDHTPEMARAVLNASQRIEGRILSLVGNSNYQMLEKERTRVHQANAIQMEFGRDLVAIDKPLTAQQLDALANAMGGNVTKDRLLESVSAILAPEQLSLLRDSLEMQEKLEALREKARNAAKKQYGYLPMPFYLRGP